MAGRWVRHATSYRDLLGVLIPESVESDMHCSMTLTYTEYAFLYQKKLSAGMIFCRDVA